MVVVLLFDETLLLVFEVLLLVEAAGVVLLLSLALRPLFRVELASEPGELGGESLTVVIVDKLPSLVGGKSEAPGCAS